MRIVSLLPSGTEIVAALGLLDQLVGVSHECDYPPAVKTLPRLIKSPIYNAGLSSAEIDARVRESKASGRSHYEIDMSLLQSLEPDLVISQMLCDVCAIGFGTVAGAVATLPKRPRLLNLEPTRLDDLNDNIREVAENALAITAGQSVIESLQARVSKVVTGVNKTSHRPRVLFLEWIDPLFGAGHWTPELIELAGGVCVVGTAGGRSVRMEWPDIVASRPDVIVIACCGFGVERIRQDIPILEAKPGWDDLPAVRAGEVYLVDGSQYFNRSGPRLIDSLEILASAVHPNWCEDGCGLPQAIRLQSVKRETA